MKKKGKKQNRVPRDRQRRPSERPQAVGRRDDVLVFLSNTAPTSRNHGRFSSILGVCRELRTAKAVRDTCPLVPKNPREVTWRAEQQPTPSVVKSRTCIETRWMSLLSLRAHITPPPICCKRSFQRCGGLLCTQLP